MGIAGWGVTENGYPGYYSPPNYASVKVATLIYESVNHILTYEVEKSSGVTHCSGDSGGPVFHWKRCRWEQVALITSISDDSEACKNNLRSQTTLLEPGVEGRGMDWIRFVTGFYKTDPPVGI